MRSSLVLILALLAPTLASAHPASRSGYRVQLEDEYGRSLNAYHHRGQTYVLGQYNHRYNVRVYNDSGRRIEAVVTVDGRDAISGAKGDYVRQRGYVIQPWSSVLVEGFRQNHSNVAAFRFTTPGDSYSGRMGTPQHVGVVGVAVFRERHRRRYRKPVAKRRAKSKRHYNPFDDDADRGAAPAPSMDALGGASAESAPRRRRSAQNLGTRYGESRYSPVVEVSFKRRRSNRPDQILAVYYDDAQGLASKGVQLYPPYSSYAPQPFPERQFAPPPP